MQVSRLLVFLAITLFIAGCAYRPVNPPLDRAADDKYGYRLDTRTKHFTNQENLVVLAFSGGGTRAAAFSFGVLETLRDIDVRGPKGNTIRLLDEVNVITGVSGGSFTALAYGLYGDELFEIFPRQFLKYNVQGELLARTLNPLYWGELTSATWGRSEMAAQLYDEILFKGATYADLDRRSGPLVVATATDISSGARLGFVQNMFDVLCSDLSKVPLSRVAAASSAVPLVLSPVTINNYGGTCNYRVPDWLREFRRDEIDVRPAQRVVRRMHELERYADSAKVPFVHLVDGGLADNLGMRGVLEVLEASEALRLQGLPSPIDNVKRIIVFIVNSLSVQPTDWDLRERAPNDIEILLRATGVPIDHFSYEAVELLKDITTRWENMGRIRNSAAMAANRDPAIGRLMDGPQARIYAIDVSFTALNDATELEYLNRLPTSFVLPDEAVDRLRAAARKAIHESPEFRRLLRDAGATIVPAPAP